jgi:sporulation protein YlmC with PRC-barrel domain
MAHYGTLRDHRFDDDVDDIRGASLYGMDDEKLGKIDDVIFDHGSGAIRYMVVDSGGWLSSKKFLIPADRIRPYAKHEDDFYADMTKKQIEALPQYDEDSFKGDNDPDWSDYDERYRKSLETTGDVLHRESSTHMITPDPSALPARGDALPNEGSLQPERLEKVFTSTAPNSSEGRLRPAGIAARAEDSAVVGQSVPQEIPTVLEDEALDREASTRAGRVPPSSSYNATTGQDAGVIAGDQTWDAKRHRRLSAFENHLQRNRVDITSSCRSCDVKKDKVA